jgi:hypothetical protein
MKEKKNNIDEEQASSRGERPIFVPATLLFVGRSPTAGMLPPHASWPAQIFGRAICCYL